MREAVPDISACACGLGPYVHSRAEVIRANLTDRLQPDTFARDSDGNGELVESSVKTCLHKIDRSPRTEGGAKGGNVPTSRVPCACAPRRGVDTLYLGGVRCVYRR